MRHRKEKRIPALPKGVVSCAYYHDNLESRLMAEKSVLVVDDDGDMCDLLRFAFLAEGYQVETATSGRAALEVIHTHPPAGVLLDLMMPQMTGYDVINALRDEGQLEKLPVIILTARNINDDDRRRLLGTRAIWEKGSMDMSAVVKCFGTIAG